MSIIYIMIPLALALVGLAVWALVWAIRSGQFDELESHGWTPVLDDDERPPPTPEAEPESGPDDAIRPAGSAGTEAPERPPESVGKDAEDGRHNQDRNPRP